MARHHVAPTKTSLFRIRRDQAFAIEGHQLLEQKRDILVAEMMGLIDAAVELQKKVDEALRAAHAAMSEAGVRMGQSKVRSAAQAVNISADITLHRREVIGVHLPAVNVTLEGHVPSYSLHDTSAWLDATSAAFRQVLELLGEMARLKVSLMRISLEVRKTVRRVNALEQIHLPDYADTIKYINDVLEEQGRESFFVLKLIKSRIEAR